MSRFESYSQFLILIRIHIYFNIIHILLVFKVVHRTHTYNTNQRTKCYSFTLNFNSKTKRGNNKRLFIRKVVKGHASDPIFKTWNIYLQGLQLYLVTDTKGLLRLWMQNSLRYYEATSIPITLFITEDIVANTINNDGMGMTLSFNNNVVKIAIQRYKGSPNGQSAKLFITTGNELVRCMQEVIWRI